ncbi:MAG TPA: TadE family protein [Mycobacteriales bacterium]|nr:TadE family protein [Mycobacteriales bacterium]
MARRRLGPAGRRDSGSTALEFAVLSVAFLVLVFLVVQAALYYHARNVVKAIAEESARAARAQPAGAGGRTVDRIPGPEVIEIRAEEEARRQWRLLDRDGDTISEPRVTGRLVDHHQVEVTVTAYPIRILPGLFGGNDLRITASAGGPVEVFKRSGED